MSSLARIINNPCSSTTFNCAKSVHILANRTSQAEVPKTPPENVPDRLRSASNVDMLPRVFIKHPASFCIHPEKLKQIIKEKDGQIFCSYLSREGQKKRKKCLMIIEKKKKLMQATGIGQYVVRNMSLVHKPSQPSSYTSYINSQLHSSSNQKRDFSHSSQFKYLERDLSEGESQESIGTEKRQPKEVFFKTKSKESLPRRRSSTESKCGKKKKKLRPIQVFKRTRQLSKSCLSNLPPDLVDDRDDAAWVGQSHVSSLAKDITKKQAPPSTTEIHRVLAKERIDDTTFFSKKKAIEDDFVIDNVFTLFDKVKIGSKKQRSREAKDDEMPFTGFDKSKTLSSDHTETYKIINSTLRRREMHLKQQFSQMGMCTQAPNKNREKASSSRGSKDSLKKSSETQSCSKTMHNR